MRVIITRPEPDAIKLKAKVEALDHEATVEPLLAVDFEDGEIVNLDEVGTLIATSRNGLRALKFQRIHTAAAKLPIFAVGPGTAIEARNLGFQLILAGKGTARDLVPEIVANVDPHAGLVVHLAGDVIAYDIAGELEDHGYRVLQPVVYRMAAATLLSDDVVEQIATGEADAVMLLSPRTADIWVSLIRKHGLQGPCGRLLHLCLSEAVAKRLAPLGALRIETAAEPTLAEMLALIT
jgi:uroporphyrinogen-III synthase